MRCLHAIALVSLLGAAFAIDVAIVTISRFRDQSLSFKNWTAPVAGFFIIDKNNFTWFYTGRSNPALQGERAMSGTFWTTVDTTLRLGIRELTGIDIQDPNKMLVRMMRQPAISNLNHLSIFSLRDLNLPHYSAPPEIFKQAQHLSLKQPNPVSALIVLAHQRNIFRSTIVDGKPVSSVLLGTGPVLGPDGHKYVIEFGEVDGRRYLSMRRADREEHFKGNEYWVFETSLGSGG